MKYVSLESKKNWQAKGRLGFLLGRRHQTLLNEIRARPTDDDFLHNGR
jgi:hypothetical protein